MVELREITSGLLFSEGPVALADGSILVVEIARRCLNRVGAPTAPRRSSRRPAAGRMAPRSARTASATCATTAASSSRGTRATAFARRARPGTIPAAGSSASTPSYQLIGPLLFRVVVGLGVAALLEVLGFGVEREQLLEQSVRQSASRFGGSQDAIKRIPRSNRGRLPGHPPAVRGSSVDRLLQIPRSPPR
jgi:hypothetical protein